MSASDKFERHFDRLGAKRKADKAAAPGDDEPLPETPVEPAKAARPIGRNDACPCGSGKKFKKCCGAKG
ncbi:hypothetical protein RAS1_03920 [Phycisphaerae bacterium RAS1]|nr:hypothetical protein RAS1_03920 [Phycisphaerae bacterium RAS1]